MLKKYLKNEKGFTMIEMMVVLLIIAVLIGGGIKFYIGHVDRAKVTKAKGEMATIQAALESYYAEKGEYPADDDGLVEAGIATDIVSTATGDAGKSKVAYIYQSDTSNSKKYTITTKAKFKNGKLQAKGEDGISEEPNYKQPQ